MTTNENEAERQRRNNAEEERHYWESLEDDRRYEVERDAQHRETAIERMEAWFFEHFEDPQIDTPHDSEDDVYIFPWGGPFEAGDVLHGQFSHEFDQKLIDAAVERIERDGTTEWAPTPTGDYYEHPEPEPDEANQLRTIRQLTEQMLYRLDQLEEIVGALPGLPGNIGHNAPPGDVGLPPYGDLSPVEVIDAIAETRCELEKAEPDPARMAVLSVRFAHWGKSFGLWLAKKGDLAVDEMIKNGVKVLSWSMALVLFHDIAQGLITLAENLLVRP